MSRGQDIPQSPMRDPLLQEKLDYAYENRWRIYRMDIGQPDEDAYPFVKDYAAQAIQEMDKFPYGRTEGETVMRKAISDYYLSRYNLDIDPKWILVGHGASEFFGMVMAAIYPGKSFATSNIHYGPFDAKIAEAGLHWNEIPTDPRRQYHYLSQEAIFNPVVSADLSYICSPNNPTGTVATEEELDAFRQATVTRKDKILIADAVYSAFIYNGGTSIPQYIAKLPPDEKGELLDHMVLIDSMSKMANVCGWRMGWAVVKNDGIRDAMYRDASSRGSANLPFQIASARILNRFAIRPDILQKQNALYHFKRNMTHKKLKEMQNEGLIQLSSEPSEGGLYTMVDLLDKAQDMFHASFSPKINVGHQVTTFVPIEGNVGSFTIIPGSATTFARLCFGTEKKNLPRALDIFHKQIRAVKAAQS